MYLLLVTILKLLCLSAIYCKEDCLVKDFHRRQFWNGEKVTFFVYVLEKEVVNIKITYKNLDVDDFFSNFYFSPSTDFSQRIEREHGVNQPYNLNTMGKANDWIKFEISSQNGTIEVTYEPNVESQFTQQESHFKDLFISASNISFCKDDKKWKVLNGKHETIPLGRDIINQSFIIEFQPLDYGDFIKPLVKFSNSSRNMSSNEYTLKIERDKVIIKSLKEQNEDNKNDIYNVNETVNTIEIYSQFNDFTVSVMTAITKPLLTDDHGPMPKHVQYEGNSNGPAVLVILSLAGYAILTIIIVFQCLYIVKKKRSTQNKNDNLEMQPLLQQEHVKVDKKEIIKNFSHQTEVKNNGIKKYKLRMKEDHRDSEKKVQKLSLGPIDPYLPTKTILILGETGTGKSTTINTMVNHLFGVELEDAERFILIENETEGKDYEYESQTDFMTAYVFPYKNGMPNCCNYIIIDTPGFGDTHGFERDQKIMLQLESFLKQDYNISHIDVAGFVVKASAPRLTIGQRYIYDGLFSMFGQDISHNIFLLVTFSEEEDPAVLRILKDADIKYNDYFKLNNDSLYIPYTEDETMEQGFNQPERIMFNWKLSENSLQKLFRKITTINPVSLSLTKVVLEENTRLRSIVGYLQKQIKEGLDKMTQLKSKQIESVRPEETKLIEQDISHTEELLVISIKEAQQLSERLKEIPLRLDPLSVHGYIELLIGNEKREMRPNYEERIEILEKLKEENDVLKVVMNNELSPGEGWLNYFQKLKEE